MKRFNLFGQTVASEFAPTVIVDPDTGLPPLTESLDVDHSTPACRGWCHQGRATCQTPGLCRTGTVMHRAVEVLGGPSDERLRSKPASDADECSWLMAAGMICIGIALSGLAAMVTHVLMGAK